MDRIPALLLEFQKLNSSNHNRYRLTILSNVEVYSGRFCSHCHHHISTFLKSTNKFGLVCHEAPNIRFTLCIHPCASTQRLSLSLSLGRFFLFRTFSFSSWTNQTHMCNYLTHSFIQLFAHPLPSNNTDCFISLCLTAASMLHRMWLKML